MSKASSKPKVKPEAVKPKRAAPTKDCRKCGQTVHARVAVCPKCGTTFERKEPKQRQPRQPRHEAPKGYEQTFSTFGEAANEASRIMAEAELCGLALTPSINGATLTFEGLEQVGLSRIRVSEVPTPLEDGKAYILGDRVVMTRQTFFLLQF